MERIENLQMRNITRRFGTTTALNTFNLEIAGGSFVTLLGPSGCGKSTALNCLAGLLDLSSGEIILNNRPIQHISAEKRGFGMVFQSYALFPHLSVLRNVTYGMEVRHVPKVERERRAQKALELVHLEQFSKRFPAQLSGGQQQRLAIARTIVLEPGLLLLDEPLSNLDANLRNEMRIEIKRLHNELNLTTVYVTHDQSEAMSLSDKVVVMRLGSIEQVGTPQEIYVHPRSLYVANFMGYANRLPVDIVGRDGDLWQVQTETGVALQATSTVEESHDWQPGQRVLACFRPDETLADSQSMRNLLHGRVQLVEYVGKAYEALVDGAGEGREAQLLVHSQEVLANGKEITFSIRPERLLLFSANDEKSVSAAATAVSPSEPVLKGR